MLCDRCKQREAKIYYTEIIGGKKKEQHLCEECAAEMSSFGKNASLGSILSGILSAASGGDVACEKCGETYGEFLETGKLGCDECYKAFGSMLLNSVRRIQGSVTHTGKIPSYLKEEMKKEDAEVEKIMHLSETEQLEIMLKKALAEENYEECARLRDEIRKLKENESNGN